TRQRADGGVGRGRGRPPHLRHNGDGALIMRWLDKLLLRLKSLLRREHIDHELDDELRFHLEQQIEENLASGMTLAEARYAARHSIGGVAQIKQECRDMRRVN